ncbi:hypothetical protein [Carnimonas bestiolae]|uniref:hypothetical protein n=1 Tax=Carnimonas bestiolae TaxID=3402172 RepID=UPI003EDBC694
MSSYASFVVRGNTKGIINRKYVLDQHVTDACNEFERKGFELVGMSPVEWTDNGQNATIVTCVLLTFRKVDVIHPVAATESTESFFESGQKLHRSSTRSD